MTNIDYKASPPMFHPNLISVSASPLAELAFEQQSSSDVVLASVVCIHWWTDFYTGRAFVAPMHVEI